MLGLKIIYSTAALEETKERLFPFSKHRSKRIRKKLIKRFGGEFRKKPSIYKMGDTLFVHPSLKNSLEAATKSIVIPTDAPMNERIIPTKRGFTSTLPLSLMYRKGPAIAFNMEVTS